MPIRTRLFDLSSRSNTVCCFCLSKSQQLGRPQQPWVSYSTRAPRTRRTASLRVARRTPLSDDQIATSIEQGRRQDESGSMRFFEQNEDGRKELDGEQGLVQSLVDPAEPEDMDQDLRELQRSLGSRDEQQAFQDVINEVDVDWKNVRTAEDIDKLTAKMAAYRNSIDKQISAATSDMPKVLLDQLKANVSQLFSSEDLDFESDGEHAPQVSLQPWSPNQRKKVARLNTALERAFRNWSRQPTLSKTDVSTVYKAYSSARLTLARGWSNVPIDVWNFLWRIFSIDGPSNPNRLPHIVLLARDMSEATVVLAPEQQLLTIEAVFDGFEGQAVGNWKRCISTLGDEGADTFQDFWKLGVKMFCRLGDIEQAERAIAKLLDHNASPRVMLSLVQVLSASTEPESQQKAWDTYREMRTLLGDTMKLSDYDQVVSDFLTANQVENALYAFVDMMSDGKIDLTKQKYMPSVVANKFFLGKWLKRLIGAGDLAGASSVVEFMQSKGVYASPIHINGLIGALQRTGGSEDVEQAGRLGWEMIEARLEFVRNRENPDRPKKVNTLASPPRATLETFSLLAESYRVRGFHDQVATLWDAFREAKISPDAFMINQLLESSIQAGDWKQALALYDSMVTQQGVAPDPYTFSALWKTLPGNRLHVVEESQVADVAATTRALFAETLKYRDVFPNHTMDGQLARKILHSFRRLGDHAGLLVALDALRTHMNFSPPEALVMEILLGTTKISLTTTDLRRQAISAKRSLDWDLQRQAGDDEGKLADETWRSGALFKYVVHTYAERLRADGVNVDIAATREEMGVM